MEGVLASVRAFGHSVTPGRVAVLLLVIATVYRLVLIARGWPALDSDEGITGLMARHILQGERPVFFYGQVYMGAFQAYWAAPLFALFGASAVTLRLSVLLLTLGFLAGVYFLGRAAYGPVVGLLALAWLAVGPPMAVLRDLVAGGGYQETLLFAALLLLGTWLRLREPNPLPRTRRAWTICLLIYAGLGLIGGLALWADLLIAPALLVVAVALLFGRTREVFSRAGVLLVIAFLIGGWPYISFNVTHGNASYTQVSQQSRVPGQIGPFPPLDHWARQTGEMLNVGLPAILGSPHVCVKQGDIWGSYPPAMASETRAVGSVCDLGNTAFSLIALAILAAGAVQLARALWRGLATSSRAARLRELLPRAGPPGRLLALRLRATAAMLPPYTRTADDVERRARLALRAMLLGVVLMTIALYTTSYDADRYQFTSARYLLPVYLCAPLLFGFLWETAASLVRKARTNGTRQRLALIAASAGIVGMLLLSLYGGAQTLAYSADSSRFAQPLLPEDQQLLAFLDAHHITAYYSDYWGCYRLAFASGERVHCAVRGEVGRPNLRLLYNRYDPWVRELAATPHPAYLLPLGSPQDRGFDQQAAAQGIPHQGYVRTVIGSYAVYYYPG